MSALSRRFIPGTGGKDLNWSKSGQFMRVPARLGPDSTSWDEVFANLPRNLPTRGAEMGDFEAGPGVRQAGANPVTDL